MSGIEKSVAQIAGRLTIDTSAALFKKGLQLKEGCVDRILDFEKVEAVDSTAVSLMLSWMRTAKLQKVQLSFVNVPHNLRSLVNLYGLAETLSLSAESNE